MKFTRAAMRAARNMERRCVGVGDWLEWRSTESIVTGIEVEGSLSKRMLPSSGWALGRSSPQNGCHCLLCSDSKARASSTTREATCRLTRSFSIIPMPPEAKSQSKCSHAPMEHPRLRVFRRRAAAARSGTSRTGPGCDRTSARNMRDAVTRVQAGPDHREAGMLSSDYAGLRTADWPSASRRERLRRHRPQCMGISTTGNRRGPVGAHPRRQGTHRRFSSVRSQPSSAISSGGAASK